MGIFSGLLGNAGTMDADKLTEEYGQILAQGENFEIGFVVIRDTFIFTDKRLILVNKQGITGKKAEYLSVPYSKITKFSVETAGHFDLDADLKIWVGSDPKPIEKEFNRKVNIYDVQSVLASHV